MDARTEAILDLVRALREAGVTSYEGPSPGQELWNANVKLTLAPLSPASPDPVAEQPAAKRDEFAAVEDVERALWPSLRG